MDKHERRVGTVSRGIRCPIIREGDDLAKFRRLLDTLEDLDDVQDVYHNVDLPEEEEEE